MVAVTAASGHAEAAVTAPAIQRRRAGSPRPAHSELGRRRVPVLPNPRARWTGQAVEPGPVSPGPDPVIKRNQSSCFLVTRAGAPR